MQLKKYLNPFFSFNGLIIRSLKFFEKIIGTTVNKINSVNNIIIIDKPVLVAYDKQLNNVILEVNSKNLNIIKLNI